MIQINYGNIIQWEGSWTCGLAALGIKSLSFRSIFDTRLPRPRHCVITTSKRFTTEVWRQGRSPPASRRHCRRVQTASPRRGPRGRVERVRSGNNFLTYLRLHLLAPTNYETPRNPLLPIALSCGERRCLLPVELLFRVRQTATSVKFRLRHVRSFDDRHKIRKWRSRRKWDFHIFISTFNHNEHSIVNENASNIIINRGRQ